MKTEIEEHLAYSLDGGSGSGPSSSSSSSGGQVMVPLVAVMRMDGLLRYRDLVREDLLRIPDHLEVPGGWLFVRTVRKSSSGGLTPTTAVSSWIRRFCLLRGKYLFMFHSPMNEKPIAVFPLKGCQASGPENNEKNFPVEVVTTARKSGTAVAASGNEGFEWEISPIFEDDENKDIIGGVGAEAPRVVMSMRFYSVSENDRNHWIQAVNERVQNLEEDSPSPLFLLCSQYSNVRKNVVLCSTLLQGPSPVGMEDDADSAYLQPSVRSGGNFNPYYGYSTNTMRGPSSVREGRQEMSGGDNNNNNNNYINDGSPLVPETVEGGMDWGARDSTQHDQQSFFTNSSYNSPQGSRSFSKYSAGAGSSPSGHQLPHGTSPLPTFLSGGGSTLSYHSDEDSDRVEDDEAGSGGGASYGEEGSQGSASEKAILDRSYALLQEEARSRELAAREKMASHQVAREASSVEESNPMRLSEMFRMLLFFVDEELCEDPITEIPLQIPYLKGQWAESMVTAVYKAYCNETGYMSLEEFIEFMDDLAILHTHVPHDDFDQPMQEYVALLDPVRLLTSIPRNLGHQSDVLKQQHRSQNSPRESSVQHFDKDNLLLRRRSIQTSTHQFSNNLLNPQLAPLSGVEIESDRFIVNFTQFYQILLKIAEIVYEELYKSNMTLALNKLLQESIVPLYAWTKGHAKRGSRDVLVLEERIPLLLTTYAPNLWKVFLMYARDPSKKVPELTLSFPEFTQASEKGLFGLPTGMPSRFKSIPQHDCLIMTENSFYRLCCDYGLCPLLQTRKQVKDIFVFTNRAKNVAKSSSKDQAPTAAFQPTFSTKHKEKSAHKVTRAPSMPMYFGPSEEARNNSITGRDVVPPPTPILPSSPGRSGSGINPPAVPAFQPIDGLGFSEFVEAISRIAVEGMLQENYNALFPTPFSKMLALLTVWGLADLKKLEEVRAIHAEELY